MVEDIGEGELPVKEAVTMGQFVHHLQAREALKQALDVQAALGVGDGRLRLLAGPESQVGLRTRERKRGLAQGISGLGLAALLTRGHAPSDRRGQMRFVLCVLE